MLHTPLTRTERRKEKTRRLLMDVALNLFFEKGIYWTKIEDITQRADVGKGTFYQYFETKEAQLQELLERGLGILLTLTAGAVGAGGRNGET
ncbi:MAG TPA: TetR/AcrR family transcriptional regulator, partial [Nitrospiria bacterium]|nr:TetR/AcrR family transcriptional regulator [Nitrospiria bacterium]